MTASSRPSQADITPPPSPFSIAVLGAGRVGGAFANSLRAAGHDVIAELHRDDDPSPIARADVIVIAVPDDALPEAVAVVERLGRAGSVVIHTCGIHGTEPLAGCGRFVAAIHPARPIASPDQPIDGVIFGVTAPDEMHTWCEAFVRDLGGQAMFVATEDRVAYHAALCIASNFAVALAADSAELLGGHEILIPALRANVENIARLGPDAALTGPVSRGDVGTVRAHLRALPPQLLESYVANARRVLARAVGSGMLDEAKAARVIEALEEAMVR